MPEGPESRMEEDVYTYIYLYDIACIGNPQLYPLNLVIPIV
jgi:hypothetical protein